MKKKLLSFALTLAMMMTMVVAPPMAEAIDVPPNVTLSNPGAHWFYDQLNADAKTIYHILCSMDMTSGTTNYDLADDFDQQKIKDYATGASRDLFNDFAAAKDAWDLEHSEVWYADSSYISFRATVDGAGKYHAYIGTGRSTDYYVQGLTGADDVNAKDAEVQKVINEIVDGAKKVDVSGLSDADAAARKVQYVHDEITRKISYRFEYECSEGNSGYIRTLYALVTHEGVCESYARSMQVILTKLDIPCVIVMGTQTAGDEPEQHMWNAVQIGGKWYAVDATWDDPIGLVVDYDEKTGKVKRDADGQIINKVRTTDTPGVDGGESDTYVLVGSQVIKKNWVSCGIVSTAEKEFEYPELSSISYGSDVAFENPEGLKVVYSSDTMEDAKAGTFDVSFKDMGAKKAKEQGYYLLLRMYLDMEQAALEEQPWSYAEWWVYCLPDNEYFYDRDDYLHVCTAQCKYIEFAITTKAPDGDYTTPEGIKASYGYYNGNGTDVLCETGLLFNPDGDYKAPPYIKNLYPDPTGQIDSQQVYRVHAEFDDVLIHPTDTKTQFDFGFHDDKNYYDKTDATLEAKRKETQKYADEYNKAASEKIGLTFQTYSSEKDENDNYKKHELHGNVKFENVTWLKNDAGEITGVEFDFQGSRMWADDCIYYEFITEGLVGKKSNKLANGFGWVLTYPSCHKGYRSQGIDWNLWGQPSLLDNPSDLDLSKIKTEASNGNTSYLSELTQGMKTDDINGRLMLVVEDISNSRPRTEDMSELLAEQENMTPEELRSHSAMYEIGFTRMCKEVVLETGQSIRLSMGFPRGVDPEKVIFKAYHFDRDENGNIIGVQEIPLAVTEYGLVVLCDSFSPFEIVAYDEGTVELDSKTYQNMVIVSTDGYGKVYVDGRVKEAIGANGFVNFDSDNPDDTHKFYIEPNKGYVVDAVSFAGTQMTVTKEDDGSTSFALSSKDILNQNDVLNVTFVPESIKAAEEKAKEETVLPDLNDSCAHTNVTRIPQQDPTCTDFGHDSGETCADCGAVLEPSNPIDPLGHNFGADDKCTRCDAVKGSVDIYDTTVPDANKPDNGTENNPANPTPDEIPQAPDKVTESVDAVITGSNVTVNDIDVSKLVNEDGDATNAVLIDMTSVANGTYVSSADLPSDSMEELVKSGVPEIAMKFSTAIVNFDATALQAIANQTRGNAFVNVAVDEIKKESLNDSQKKSVGDRKVYAGIEASISVNGSNAFDKIRDFGSGNVTLSIPFQPDDSTDPKGLAVWYADDDGGLVRHITKYENNHIVFATSHFSSYVVMYEEPVVCALDASCPIHAFNDADMSQWYHDGVHYMLSHKYMYGTNNGFEPSIPVTRAMVIQMLYAIAKPSDSYPVSPFTDVNASAWYVNAVNWAAATGVTAGYGEGANRTFRPNEQISRQQLATMLYSYANKPACVGNVASYADSSSVESWATDALTWATNYGIITGNLTDGQLLLDPAGQALRSQTATMIMQFVRRTI